MLETIKKNARTTFEIFKVAGKEYGEDRVSRMSAAVSYRAIFALAPLFLVAAAIFGIFLGNNADAEARILATVAEFAGAQVAEAVSDVLESFQRSGGLPAIVGFALLLWTSSTLFMELQNCLNDIFHVPHERTTGFLAFLRQRGIGFLSVLALGLLFIAVWLLNLLWGLLEGLFPDDWAPVHTVISFLAPVVSLAVLPLVIALAFQVLSRVKVKWRAIWWGAFFTSVAFLAAAYGAGLYFSLAGSSAAGVAGSIFVILLLAFILSSVYLFGAQVTKVYNDYLETGVVRRPNLGPERAGDPEVVIGAPEPSIPLAAVFAFLGGLLLGWRRRP
jgi:membrane protein